MDDLEKYIFDKTTNLGINSNDDPQLITQITIDQMMCGPLIDLIITADDLVGKAYDISDFRPLLNDELSLNEHNLLRFVFSSYFSGHLSCNLMGVVVNSSYDKEKLGDKFYSQSNLRPVLKSNNGTIFVPRVFLLSNEVYTVEDDRLIKDVSEFFSYHRETIDKAINSIIVPYFQRFDIIDK